MRPDLSRSRRRAAAASADVFDAPTARLDSLTGLRFFAAILVVFHHSVSNPNHAAGIATLGVLEPLATIGYTGVSFFFALSGFVLAWSWRPGRGPREFWVRRFARVYPLHLVTWLAAIAIAVWLGNSVSGSSAVVGGLLLQAWSPDTSVTFALNAPSWSLSCEAFFYAAFPLLIIPLSRLSVRRLGIVALASFLLLAAVPLSVWMSMGRSAVGILYYFPAYRVLEFVIGICLALAMRRGWKPVVPAWVGPMAVIAGLGLTIGLGALYVSRVPGATSLPRPGAALIMAPFYVALIAIAAAGDVMGRRSFFARPFMVKLGTWSFAAYMTHLLLLQVVEHFAGPLLPVSGDGPNALVVVIVLVGATLVSASAYSVVEQPLERLARRGLLRSTHTRRSVPTRQTASPRATVPAIVAVMGDEFSVSGRSGARTWPSMLGSELGVRTQVLGGAGVALSQPAGSSFVTLAAKVDPDAAAVIVMASRRDQSTPTLSLVRFATETVAAVRRVVPKAALYLVGPVWTTDDGSATVVRVSNALRGAAELAGITWVDPTAENWFANQVPITQVDSEHIESVTAARLADELRPVLKEKS